MKETGKAFVALARRLRQRLLAHRDPLTREEQALLRLMRTELDAAAYLEAYPDVARAKVDPFLHWIRHGALEGRRFPGLQARIDVAGSPPGEGWRPARLRGRPSWVRFSAEPLISARLVDEIVRQGAYEPALLLPGAQALPHLRMVEATDLRDRDGVDMAALFARAPEDVDAVIVTPFLAIGGAEKYAADFAEALGEAGFGARLAIVTDQRESEAQAWREQAILRPFVGCRVLFWRDVCLGAADNPVVMGRYLNAIRPRAVLVVNSRVGLETVSMFGRGLSQFATIACAYFSIDPKGLAKTYGMTFPRRTAPFAYLLTDNAPMGRMLERLYGAPDAPGVRLVPPRLEAVDEERFRDRLRRRAERPATGTARKWVWVSRIEPFKGVDILIRLAELRGGEEFHLFGPCQDSPRDLGLTARNIVVHPPIKEVGEADFSSYDGFLFTSLFEGMPNVALEMSQHALPMVLAEVGGLRDTFDESAAIFVAHETTAQETALGFSQALDRVARMSAADVESMARAARDQAVARHGRVAHAAAVASVMARDEAPPPERA